LRCAYTPPYPQGDSWTIRLSLPWNQALSAF
jgi:hypothetical protein